MRPNAVKAPLGAAHFRAGSGQAVAVQLRSPVTCPTNAFMSAAIALILLAETSTTCAPVGASRLGGRATFVRPVGTLDPMPFERLGPAPGIVTRPSDMQRVAGTHKDDAPEGDSPADPCEVTGITII